MRFYLYAAVVVLVMAGIFAIQNSDVMIDVKFIKWTFAGPAVSVLAVSFAAGVFVSMFFFIPPWLKKASQARSSGKRIQQLESELEKISRQADAGVEEQAATGQGG